MNIELFLNDVNDARIDEKVKRIDSVDEAAQKLTEEIQSIINKHGPEKVVQLKNNYNRAIQDDTKETIRKRNRMRIDAMKENNDQKYK